MSSDISGYLGNKILRWLAGNAMPSAPSTVYCGLFSGNPKTGGTEVTTSIRAAGRVAVSFSSLSSGTGTQIDNSADVDFGASDGSATLAYVGFFDASSGGNLLWSRALVGGPYAITASMPVKFNTGGIVFNCGE